LPKLDAPEGYTVAWKANTQENIRRLRQEGWEVASRLEHNIDTEMGDYYKKVNDSPVSEETSNITHNELIAMVLPEDMAEARRQYYKDETEKQTRSRMMAENATGYGGVVNAAQVKTTVEIN
jgi:hypothetical protein